LIRLTAAALLLAAIASPALAQNDPLSPLPPETEDTAPPEPDATTVTAPAQPATPAIKPVVVPKDWRGVFTAIRNGDWAGAQAGIATLPDDGLKTIARAELYTAANSPKVDLPALIA